MSQDPLIAFKKHGTDILGLIELIQDIVEAKTSDVANREHVPKPANWGDVGSLEGIRDALFQIVVADGISGDQTETEVREEVRMDLANFRAQQDD